MKLGYYKWILAITTIFFFAVSDKIYGVITGITEDNMVSVFQQLDYDHNGHLSKQEQGFIKYCSKSNQTPQMFGKGNPKIISQQEYQLGLRPFIESYVILVAKGVNDCRELLEKITDPFEIDKLPEKKRKEAFQKIYDLNKNGKVEWKEYNLVNQLFGTDLGESVTVFTSRDKNGDYVLSKEEQ